MSIESSSAADAAGRRAESPERPASHGASVRAALRRAGAWSLVAAGAIALTPVTVFAIPWGAIDPALADGTSHVWHDPLVWMRFPWLGPVYALQGVLFAVAFVAATLSLSGSAREPDLPRRGGALARLRLGAAFVAAGLFLAEGGIGSVEYSASAVGMVGILGAQADAGVREAIGVGLTYVLNGLAGAVGLSTLAWLIAAALGLRRTGAAGRAPIVVVAVFGAVMLAAYCLGFAAGAQLIAMLPLAVLGVVLLVCARRR